MPPLAVALLFAVAVKKLTSNPTSWEKTKEAEVFYFCGGNCVLCEAAGIYSRGQVAFNAKSNLSLRNKLISGQLSYTGVTCISLRVLATRVIIILGSRIFLRG